MLDKFKSEKDSFLGLSKRIALNQCKRNSNYKEKFQKFVDLLQVYLGLALAQNKGFVVGRQNVLH